MYTINFAFDSMTVVPLITSSSSYALQGDSIIFNASNSYVTNQPDSKKYLNLTFLWICPEEFNTFCYSENSTIDLT
jgi:hypothetical protein